MNDRAPPMKPTPTPEMIEQIARIIDKSAWQAIEDGRDALPHSLWGIRREGARHTADEVIAALSVPAAAVVGEPEGWKLVPVEPTPEMASKGADAFFSPQPQSIEDENARAASVYRRMLAAAPSAPDGWKPIEMAPKDGTEILAYGYARCDGSRYANGQHIAWWDNDLGWTGRDPDDRVTLHLSHWRPLPAPPALGGAHE